MIIPFTGPNPSVSDTKTPTAIEISALTISEIVNPLFGDFLSDSWSTLMLMDKYAETTPVIIKTYHNGLAVKPSIPLVTKSYPSTHLHIFHSNTMNYLI